MPAKTKPSRTITLRLDEEQAAELDALMQRTREVTASKAAAKAIREYPRLVDALEAASARVKELEHDIGQYAVLRKTAARFKRDQLAALDALVAKVDVEQYRYDGGWDD